MLRFRPFCAIPHTCAVAALNKRLQKVLQARIEDIEVRLIFYRAQLIISVLQILLPCAKFVKCIKRMPVHICKMIHFRNIIPRAM